jgi:hypothetical protein
MIYSFVSFFFIVLYSHRSGRWKTDFMIMYDTRPG